MLIRQATPDDASSIAYIKIAGWRFAYTGIMPDAVLDAMRHEDITKTWHRYLSQATTASLWLVSVDDDGTVTGYANGGREREAVPDYSGELYAIYVHPAHHGKGIGRALLTHIARWLHTAGYGDMLIWVLRDNHQARRFYEAVGGQPVAERTIQMGGVNLPEIGYGWKDLTPFTAS